MKLRLLFLLIFLFSILSFSLSLSEETSETEILSPRSIKKVIGEWSKFLEEILKKGWERREEIWQSTKRGMNFLFKIVKSLFLKFWEWINIYILSFPPIQKRVLKVLKFLQSYKIGE